MKGTERGPNGTLRYFYQYKVGGTKYYYHKSDHGKLRMPFIPNFEREDQCGGAAFEERHEYHEYVPEKPKGSKIEQAFDSMANPIKALITTWLLVMGFQTLNDVTPDEVAKVFRRLSLIHHPDRGGREESYKELSNVRDYLLTLCKMASVL